MLSSNASYRMPVRYALALLFLALLSGCAGPSKEKVSRDFQQLFAKEVGKAVQSKITSVGPGEGDSGNVYQHIRFDVVAVEDVVLTEGWLAGTSLKKGQKLYDGEAVIFYQDTGQKEWQLVRYGLERKPSPVSGR